MPIFEYVCQECKHQFELLVRESTKLECPTCKSAKLEKQLSVFAAVGSSTTLTRREMPVAPCGSCGDPRGAGSCSMN
ncbi:MAG: zinc ribbon domain-containing protein [Acidobacteriota bacterium]